MQQSADSYAGQQALISACINVVLNPALSWLGHRSLEFVPTGGVVVDTVITTLVLPLLVALIVSPAVLRERSAGRVAAPATGSGALRLLPIRPWKLGLTLGAASLPILVPLTLGLCAISSGLPFAGLALYKALYTGALAYVVTRLVVHRQLSRDGLAEAGP